jgi:hypothetical protein
MNKHYCNDDDAFDERGLLRDGRVYRAKLTMMDHDPTHRRRIVDTSGDALGLHRPGYRATGGLLRLSAAQGRESRRFASGAADQVRTKSSLQYRGQGQSKPPSADQSEDRQDAWYFRTRNSARQSGQCD